MKLDRSLVFASNIKKCVSQMYSIAVFESQGRRMQEAAAWYHIL